MQYSTVLCSAVLYCLTGCTVMLVAPCSGQYCCVGCSILSRQVQYCTVLRSLRCCTQRWLCVSCSNICVGSTLLWEGGNVCVCCCDTCKLGVSGSGYAGILLSPWLAVPKKVVGRPVVCLCCHLLMMLVYSTQLKQPKPKFRPCWTLLSKATCVNWGRLCSCKGCLVGTWVPSCLVAL